MPYSNRKAVFFAERLFLSKVRGVKNTVDERKKWNRRYTTRNPVEFGAEPTPWLVMQRPFLTHDRGKALDLACGNGKNSFYLAELGYQVDAVDISDIVVDYLQAEANRRGARIDARRENLREASLPLAAYDVIVNCRYLERRLFPMIEEALRPGGLVIVETFTRRDSEISGRNFPPELLLDDGELRRSFPRLEIVAEREEVIVTSSMNPRAVASLAARKAPSSVQLRKIDDV